MRHLFVGLGGFGGRALGALHLLAGEPAEAPFDYLHVDSDAAALERRLARRSQLLVAQPDRHALLEGAEALAQAAPQIGPPDEWREAIGRWTPGSGAGGVRRIGRLLFAMGAQRFRESVALIAQDLAAHDDEGLTVHLICALGGGTGSAALIDAVAILRTLFPDSPTRIQIYAAWPDPAADAVAAANAYATLIELDAIATGAWAPREVAGRGSPSPAVSPVWFDDCFMAGSADRSPGVLPAKVAGFIFARALAIPAQAAGVLTAAEGAPGAGDARFRGLGYALATAVRLEMADDARSADTARRLFVVSGLATTGAIEPLGPARQRDWRLTPQHLSLSSPILAHEAWKSIDAEWSDWQEHYAGLVRGLDHEAALDRLGELFGHAFKGGFRGLGVERFYADAGREKRRYADEVAGGIERGLLEEWHRGRLSLAACSEEVGQVLDDLAAHRASAETAARNREAASAALQGRVAAIRARASRRLVGAGQHERDLDEAAFLMREDQVARTLAAGSVFAASLAEELRVDLTRLLATIGEATAALGKALGSPATQSGTEYEASIDPEVEEARRRQVAETGQATSFGELAHRLTQLDTSAILASARERRADGPTLAALFAEAAPDLLRTRSGEPDGAAWRGLVIAPPTDREALLGAAAALSPEAGCIFSPDARSPVMALGFAGPFPLTAVRAARPLRERFHERLAGEARERARFETHVETRDFQDRFELAPTSRLPVLLLLGLAVGALTPGRDGGLRMAGRGPDDEGRPFDLDLAARAAASDLEPLRAALQHRLGRLGQGADRAAALIALERTAQRLADGFGGADAAAAWAAAQGEAVRILNGETEL